MTYTKLLIIPPYNIEIFACYCAHTAEEKQADAWHRIAKHTRFDDFLKEEDRTREFYMKSGGTNFVMSNEKYISQYILWLTEYDAITLTHECFHLTSLALRGIGIPLNDDTEEVYAHLMGYVSQKVNDFVHNSNKKMKKTQEMKPNSVVY